MIQLRWPCGRGHSDRHWRTRSVTRLPHATATVWTNFPSSTSEENLAATHF
jgi:hypothetical protein